MYIVSISCPRRIGTGIATVLGCALFAVPGGASPKAHIAPTAAMVKFLTPTIALKRLQAGSKRFVTGHAQHPHADAARLAETAQEQHPFATILTCSDSRLSPEILFDQGIGDLFTVRVAGNVCDTDEIGTIEYGVDHLKTPLLLVMGHAGCGAVKAVVSEAEVHGSIPALVDNIAPAADKVVSAHADWEEDALIAATVKENVWQSVGDLFRHSKEVRELTHEGKLKVVGAVYDIRTGSVAWMGAHPQQEALLKEEGDGDTAAGVHGEADTASGGSTSPLSIFVFSLVLLVGVALLGVGFKQYRDSAAAEKDEKEDDKQEELKKAA